MSSSEENFAFDINAKTKEAEAYRRHGLLKEARELYEEILNRTPGIKPAKRASFQEKIRLLEQEIQKLDDLEDTLSVKTSRSLKIHGNRKKASRISLAVFPHTRNWDSIVKRSMNS